MSEVIAPPVDPITTSPSVPRLKNMVEQILAENPKYQGIEARNSDIALLIIIWQRWYGVSDLPNGTVHVRRLLDLPREDNVKRVRAKIQNEEHKYLPTNPDVLVKRGILEEYWSDALGYNLTKEEWRRHHQTNAELKAGEQSNLSALMEEGRKIGDKLPYKSEDEVADELNSLRRKSSKWFINDKEK